MIINKSLNKKKILKKISNHQFKIFKLYKKD